jgi:pantothenate kinase
VRRLGPRLTWIADTTMIVELDQLADMLRQRSAAERTLTGIAGPPGSGKSTLAASLVADLNGETPGIAAVLPMDGYHFDDTVLEERGMRARKGAPDTFDVAGFRHMLARLRRNEEAEIAVPVFDRNLEIARAGARLIPRSVRHLVVEGNYLLLDRDPWSSIAAFFDRTVMLVVPEAVLRQRLTDRWKHYKLSPEAVLAKLQTNDLPNGRLVSSSSIQSDYVISQLA